MALCAIPLSDYTAEKLVDLWDEKRDSPRAIDYTLFEETVGALCKEYGKTPSEYFGLRGNMPEVAQLAIDMRYSAAAQWLETQRDKAGNIMSERNSGNSPGRASAPATRRTAHGGVENYMKHKAERASHGRRTDDIH